MSTDGGITEAMVGDRAIGGDDLERVADAIDQARYRHPDYPRERVGPFSETGRTDREYAFRLARAALAAQKGEGVREESGDKFVDWRDLPPATRAYLDQPEGFIAEVDGSPIDHDENTINASDAVSAINGLVTILRSPTPASWNEAVEACAKIADEYSATYLKCCGPWASPMSVTKQRPLSELIRALTRPGPAPEETRK